VQGTGDCCGGSGGLGTYEFAYHTSGFADGHNSWRRKTVETLPDGNQNIVFTNFAGQVMLSVFKDVTTSDEWITYHRYDADGRLILTANPSAVSGYDETEGKRACSRDAALFNGCAPNHIGRMPGAARYAPGGYVHHARTLVPTR
jgi:hypothetical protein